VTYAEGPASGGVGSDLDLGNRGPGGIDTVELRHTDVHEQLSEYLDGTLDEVQTARLLGHLRDCAICAADLATLRHTTDVLRTLPARPAPEPLRQRLLAIPDAEQAAQ